MSIQRLFLGLSVGALTTCVAFAQSERIRINQVGYALGQPKFAVSLDSAAVDIVDSASGASVLQPVLNAQKYWTAAEETAWILDFSALEKPGTYLIKIGTQTSYPVRIQATPYMDLTRASIKAFWYNRSSYALPAAYAGKWARDLGHIDTSVYVHASAASDKRPEDTRLSSPGGWYDAGDYGKYIINSGITTWTLLHLYESAPAFFDTLSLNVPAHAVKSDLVDEILWNLRWMLTMQDPNDGGVYSKLTTADFSGFVMPAKDKARRWLIQKSTASALDFAAVTAYAARLFKNDPQLKSLADSCLTKSLAAWEWARLNPKAIYNQDTVNAYYYPLISTGTYADGTVSDEFLWASSEIFLTTQNDSFAVACSLSTKAKAAKTMPAADWASVGSLGRLSLLSNKSLLTGSLAGIGNALDSALLTSAKGFRDARKSSAYHLPTLEFYWGSNAVIGNRGIMLWKAWEVSGDTSYRNASLEVLDYLLGRNATGYSFVTGQGSKTPMKPHHRPSGADGVVDPVPGFLVGGPNAQGPSQDNQVYASTLAPKAYTDVQGSFASNEIAINWNAPLAYLAGVWSARNVATAAGISSHAVKNGARLDLNLGKGSIRAQMPGRTLAKLELLGVDGRSLARSEGSASSLELKTSARGLFLVRALAVDGSAATSRILIP